MTKPEFAACTIIAKNYLPMARVLTESWQAFHPGCPLFVLLLDSPLGFFAPEAESFTTVYMSELDIPNLSGFFFKYTILEASTAVKPYLLSYLFRRYGLQKLLYLDPDILIFDSLDPLRGHLDEANLLLTPHLLSPLPNDGHRPSDHSILKTGTYNLGFLGMRWGPESERLLRWWSGKTYHHCLLALEQNLFVDQRWMDLAPGLCDGVRVLHEPGYNVAYWNLHERFISIRDSICVNGSDPLRFFHFSGFDADKPWIVSKNQDRLGMADIGDACKLYSRYRELLIAKGWEEAKVWKYDHDFFRNGVPIPLSARRYYWSLGTDVMHLGDPYSWPDSDSPGAGYLRTIEADGIPLENLLSRYPAMARQQAVMESSHEVRVQVFPFGAVGHSEETSLSQNVMAGTWHTLIFELPDGMGQGPLRVDPGDEPSFIEIAEILMHSLSSGDLLWSAPASSGGHGLEAAGTAAWFPIEDGSCLISFGDDPRLMLPAPPDKQGALKMTITLRVNPAPMLAPEIVDVLIKAGQAPAQQRLAAARLERDRIAQELTQATAEKETITSQLSRALAQRNTIARDLFQAIAEKNTIASEKNAVASELSQAVAEKNTTKMLLSAAEDRFRQEEAIRMAMQQSLSWRTTDPIRKLMNALRSGPRKVS